MSSSILSALQPFGAFSAQRHFEPYLNSAGNPSIGWLNHLTVVSVYGKDAERFLQGQFTCNMSLCTPKNTLFGACCNPKGKTICNFIVHYNDQGYDLILPVTGASILIKHLEKYAVFFKVTMKDESNNIAALGKISSTSESLPIREPFTSDDINVITLNSHQSIQLVHINDLTNIWQSHSHYFSSYTWQLKELQQGLLWITEALSNRYIPQNFQWHIFPGISFDKGCYTGQEIIARIQFLGKQKKTLYQISWHDKDNNSTNDESYNSHTLNFEHQKNIPILQIIEDGLGTYHGLAIINHFDSLTDKGAILTPNQSFITPSNVALCHVEK
jgi:folate-binding protein YgfZ